MTILAFPEDNSNTDDGKAHSPQEDSSTVEPEKPVEKKERTYDHGFFDKEVR